MRGWEKHEVFSSLPLHLAVLAMLLVGIASFVGFDGYFFVDEGALIGQVELRVDGRWTIPMPFPDRDPDQRTLPMVQSWVNGDGSFAPFAKHPLHVELATASRRLLGSYGLRVLSIAGTVTAAGTAALWARRTGRRQAIATLWVTGALSPLVFDSQLVIAHTLAAAVAATLLLLVWHQSAIAIAAAVPVAATGVLLRTEFVLLAGSLALVIGAVGLFRRSVSHVAAAAAVAVGAGAAHLLEPHWSAAVAGGQASSFRIADPAGGSVESAFRSSAEVLFSPGSYGSTPMSRGLLLIVVVLAASAVAVILFRPTERLLSGGLLAAAVILSLVRVGMPTLTPGLLIAFPLLTCALVALPWIRPTGAEGWAGAAAIVFAASVALLQYEAAGAVEWGWRYFAIGLPLVTPMLGSFLVALYERMPRSYAPLLVGGVVLSSALVPVNGFRFQREVVRDTNRLVEGVTALAAEADYVVSMRESLGRFAWPVSIEGRLATAPDGMSPDVLRWLHDDGAERVLLFWQGAQRIPPEGTGPYRVEGLGRLQSMGYAYLTRPGTNTRSPT